jgi:hypothetical protein
MYDKANEVEERRLTISRAKKVRIRRDLRRLSAAAKPRRAL